MSMARWKIVLGVVVLCVFIVAAALVLPYRGPDSQDKGETVSAADIALENWIRDYPARAPSPSVSESGGMEAVDSAHKPVTEAALRKFIEDYSTPRVDERKAFERHLDKLGPQVMLDYLEQVYPFCDSEALDLGRVIFARTQDVNQSLRICGRRCTGGCMHGVVLETFKDQTIDEVKAELEQFCESGGMSEGYEPGSCAHGLGHALMWVAGRDLGEALDACATYPTAGMRYYCATGVYMEYFEERRPGGREDPKGVDPETVGLHYPCDTYTRFPVACYMFQGGRMLSELGRDRSKLIVECLMLPKAQRIGCFYGYGAAVKSRVMRDPRRLSRYCKYGSVDDRAVCIEGIIEKLADHDEALALEACANLSGANAEVCEAAARGKMYRLDKATMPLFVTP